MARPVLPSAGRCGVTLSRTSEVPMNRPVPSAVRGRSHRPRTPVRAGRFRDDAPPLPDPDDYQGRSAAPAFADADDDELPF